MIQAKIRIGDKVKVAGVNAEVVSIDVTPYSDMGCGPVFDITSIKCKSQGGAEMKIIIEEGISNE